MTDERPTEKSKRGYVPLTAALILLGLGVLSLLVCPGTRSTVAFNFQQIRPARAGNTYFSFWHVPSRKQGCFATNARLPVWRRWKTEYNRRKGDWRIHAARGFQPSPVWDGGNDPIQSLFCLLSDKDAPAESLREYQEAARLASRRPELHLATALAAMRRANWFAGKRVRGMEDGYQLQSPDEIEGAQQEVLDLASREVAEARKLDPGNSFPLLVEAWVMFSWGRHEQAFEALAQAKEADGFRDYQPALHSHYLLFLASLGVPESVARDCERSVWTTWPLIDLESFLGILARIARDSGRHEEAIRRVRYAVMVSRTLRGTGRVTSIALQLAEYRGKGGRDAELSEAVAYLRAHNAEDLADEVEEEREAERHRATRKALWRRRMSLSFFKYAALFGAAALLMHLAVLVPLWLVSLLKRSRETIRLEGWQRRCLHPISLAWTVMAAVCGAAVGSRFTSDGLFSNPPPPFILLLVFASVILITLFTAGLLVSKDDKAPGKHLRLTRKGLAVLFRHVLPRILAYSGGIYVILVWTTYLLAEKLQTGP